MTDPLIPVLERARELGFLGPGPVEPHVEHAEGLTRLVAELGLGPTLRAVDLGSGGGLPGLVVACQLTASTWLLLDAQQRRADFLRWAVAELALQERVEVRQDRAERAGRAPDLRAQFSVVCARSFGPPAVTAECGAPFLRVGGRLIVSEPPDPVLDRWPADGLALLGLAVESIGSWAVLRQEHPVPDGYPRRDGQPTKRPLW